MSVLKLTMSVQQQQFIQILIETGDKLSLEDFFKSVHQKFYSNYDTDRREAPIGATKRYHLAAFGGGALRLVILS